MIAAALALWQWWRDEMIALLPSTWHPQRDRWLAVWRDGRLDLMRSQGATLFAADAPPPDTRLTLRIEQARSWRRELTMPRAARPYVRNILEQELDRRTPWRPDQVYFHAAARPHAEQPGALAVALTCLPRISAEPALAALAERGWSADRIELAEGAVVMLEGSAESRAEFRSWPGLALAALLALALLSLGGQALVLTWLEAESALAGRQANTTRALASEVAALSRRQHFPNLRRQELAATIAMLDHLARALPDDSWAEEIEITGASVTVGGISAEPARLLAALQSQGFSAAEFRAPVTKAENGQKFVIRSQFGEAGHAPR